MIKKLNSVGIWIVTNKGLMYFFYLLILVIAVFALGNNLPKYELIEKNKDQSEQSGETENSIYRKFDGDVEGFQLILTNGEGIRKVIDPLCIYEKIEDPEKLYVEISRNDLP